MNRHTLKKLAIRSESWDWHHSGWRYVLLELRRSIHHPDAPRCYGYLDRFIGVTPIDHPYIGFLHGVPASPPSERAKYKANMSLEQILGSECWRKHNESFCRGIFTLCEYTQAYLKNRTTIPIEALVHPIQRPGQLFSMRRFVEDRRRVLMVGQWLRDFDAFTRLQPSRARKILLRTRHPGADNDFREGFPAGCEIVDFLPPEEFDGWLTSSVVFEKYIDVAASNTILECIVRNTPILLNRRPAAIEYLGDAYPFFYETIEQAAAKLDDDRLIEETTNYLSRMDKGRFSIRTFVNSVTSSAIFQRHAQRISDARKTRDEI